MPMPQSNLKAQKLRKTWIPKQKWKLLVCKLSHRTLEGSEASNRREKNGLNSSNCGLAHQKRFELAHAKSMLSQTAERCDREKKMNLASALRCDGNAQITRLNYKSSITRWCLRWRYFDISFLYNSPLSARALCVRVQTSFFSVLYRLWHLALLFSLPKPFLTSPDNTDLLCNL